MPINKAARFRFEIIDECLRNSKKKWAKSDLLFFVNRRLELHFGAGTSISSSQLRYDLESMQSEYGAPIEMYREGRNYLYRYEDLEFSIKNLPVEDEDLVKLNTAVNLLQQIKGFTIADEIAEIVSKLESRYRFANQGSGTIISFDSAPGIQGLENLEDIYHAIIRRNVLKITYQTFQSKIAREWNIHPYLLKEYNNRWYLLGRCNEKNAVGTYALDRMKQIKVIKESYIPCAMQDPEEYFKDIIGVNKPAKGKVTQIELLFSSEFAPYILTKPIHGSQIILGRWQDGSAHVQLQLMVNPELISLLLSYGKEVTVVSPSTLQLEIRAAATILLDHYDVE